MADQNENPFEGFNTTRFVDGEPVQAKTSVPPVDEEGDDDAGQDVSRDRGGDRGAEDRSEDDRGAGDRDSGAPYDPFDLSEFSDEPDDQDDSEDDDLGESDGDEPDDEGDGEGERDSDDKGQRSSRKSARARIKELTKARREAERQNAELVERLARLEGRLDARGDQKDDQKGDQKGDAQQDTSQQDDGVDLSDLKKPDPTDEKYKFGEVDSEYISDMVSYNVAVQMRKQQAAAEKQRQEAAATEKQKQVQKGWQTLGQKGLELHDDFAEVVFEGAQSKKWALSETMAEMLPESEVGPQIAYHLARNPKESARVAGLSPTEQARYFGRIEAKFLAQSRAAKGKDDSGEPKRLKAPRKQPRGSGGRFTRTDAGGGFAEFERRVREEEEAGKKR
jgi:hypothetical protein